MNQLRRLAAVLCTFFALSAGMIAESSTSRATSDVPVLNQTTLSSVLTNSLTVAKLPTNLTPSLSFAASVQSISRLTSYLGALVSCDPVRNANYIAHPAPCWMGDTSSSKIAVLWGDSSTQAWAYVLSPYLASIHVKLAYFLYSGCYSPNVVGKKDQSGTTVANCNRWHAALPAAVQALNPAILISSSAGHTSITTDSAWIAGYKDFYTRLSSTNTTQKFLIGTTPDFPGPIPNCVSLHKTLITKCNLAISSSYTKVLTRDIAVAQAANATLVPAVSWVCVNNKCPAVIDKYLAYRDFRHFFFPVLDYLRPVVTSAMSSAGLN